MAKLVRLERWSDRESNSGARLDFCRVQDTLKAEEYRELNGREELDLSIDPAHGWATDLAERDVVRTVFADDSYDEWRVWRTKHGRSQNGARRFEVLCRSIKFDLGDELVAFPQANGTVFLHHELADITPSDFLDAIDALPTWPSDFTKGTVEPTTRHTWVLDWESYLSALTEAATVTGGELDVSRDGTSGYVVDLLDEVRSGERTEIRFRANALESEVERDWSDAGTLIYPKGEGPQGAAPTIGDMRWFAVPQPGESSPTTDWRLFPFDGTAQFWQSVKLRNPVDVITEDDQFNGLYWGVRGETGVEITDSSIANAGKSIDVTLASAITQPAGTRWLLADSDGNELLYVPVPSKIATHGRKAYLLERDDIPGVTNLVSLPFEVGREGVHWLPWGSPTVTEVTLNNLPEYVHYGDSSAKVEAAAEQGVSKYANQVAGNDSYMVSPEHPHLSFQVYGHLVSGSVRFEVFFVFTSPIADGADTGTIYRFPFGEDAEGNPIEARAVAQDSTFHMSIEPQLFNFSFTDGQVQQVGHITNLELRVTAREDGTVFYLDAWQVVNSPVIGEKIVSGASSLKLWDAACRAIQGGASEPEVRLRTTALDFDRLGTNPLTGATYTYGAIHPGVTARLVDEGIGLAEERRIKSVRRDLLREALTAIELVGADSVA